MGASSCRLALARVHYVLGEVKEADEVMKSASSSGQILFYNLSLQKAKKAQVETPEKSE